MFVEIVVSLLIVAQFTATVTSLTLDQIKDHGENCPTQISDTDPSLL